MSCFEVVIAIINIVVIIVSPIAAVAIGQKLQDRSQMRKDKLDVFKVLMMNRSMGWSYESTRALNIIDVVFADDEVVRTKWGEYYTLLCIQNPNEMQRSRGRRLRISCWKQWQNHWDTKSRLHGIKFKIRTYRKVW